MGLFRATGDAVGGTFADQWKDFLTVPPDISPTSALFPAKSVGQDGSRGSNTKKSSNVVTNGSRIIVPEGYGLLLFQDGALTGFVAEAGGYVWDTENEFSQSLFVGDGVTNSIIKQSWERFKFGGRPGTQQIPLFVRLKELGNNKFGTTSPVFWDDAYLKAQVGVIAHGTYTVKIVDPIKFAVDFVPATYLQGLEVFDFTDPGNPFSRQLSTEFAGSLSAGFSRYTNAAERENRITKVQGDAIGFAASMQGALEDAYSWTSIRGIEVSNVALLGIDYDEDTREILRSVQRADALAGSRGNSNLQASVAQGLQTAGAVSGSEGILGLGIAGGTLGLGGLIQGSSADDSASEKNSKLKANLRELKEAMEEGLISSEEYEAARRRILGLE
jgi:membrane protease subunit (stomatin/prohibitin family)